MHVGEKVVEKNVSLEALLDRIVPVPELHAKLLNTLSYMEHIGATKIARTQSGPQASLMVLKHAAEEARHAFYLKKLSDKLISGFCPDYSHAHLLAPLASRQYLYRLDASISRLLKSKGLGGKALHDLAYLLVTYAIEVRADEIYPIYQRYLRDYPVRLSVQSIINEEVGHLEEMNSALAEYPKELSSLKDDAVEIESALYVAWLSALDLELQ